MLRCDDGGGRSPLIASTWIEFVVAVVAVVDMIHSLLCSSLLRMNLYRAASTKPVVVAPSEQGATTRERDVIMLSYTTL